MPELKRTFTGGKMEKDLDERILPNGQYREALNIGVATSEDSDVGAAQNILGNIRVTQAISSLTYYEGNWGNEHVGRNYHIAEIVDPQTDMLYRFIHTPLEDNAALGFWMDRIVEYDTSKSLKTAWEVKENSILVDIFKVRDRIVDHSCICIGSNKSEIKVSSFTNQLRWGMLVEGPEIPAGTTIEKINYSTGWITLSAAIWTSYPAPPAAPDCDQCAHCQSVFTFTSDRNLNFDKNRNITGVNVIDGMIFWTDNFSEPKKINIKRSKGGSKARSTPTGGIYPTGTSKIDDFNQHTLLVTIKDLDTYIFPVDCMKDESFCPLLGCTDPLAYNYDPSAVYDDPDDPCCLIAGCTQQYVSGNSGPENCNYDPDACFDDGSCCEDCGCTDPVACNYDSTIDTRCDDGSCTYGSCMDALASNYDPTGGCPDNSLCVYKFECVPSGYATSDCPDSFSKLEMEHIVDGVQIHPSEYPEGTISGQEVDPIYMVSHYTIPDDSVYVNNPSNSNSGVSGPIPQEYTIPVGMHQYFAGGSAYGQAIGSRAHYAFNSTPFTTALEMSGKCVEPFNNADYSAGTIWKSKADAIILPDMWHMIDGKSYHNWMGTNKDGAFKWLANATVGNIVQGQTYTMLSQTGLPPGQHGPGEWNFFNTSSGMTPIGSGVGEFSLAEAGQVIGVYEDINGTIWQVSTGSNALFGANICFGVGCDNYMDSSHPDYIPSIDLFGGYTSSEMTEWIADSGFSDTGWQPGIGLGSFGMTYSTDPNGSEFAPNPYFAPTMLMSYYHGTRELLGTTNYFDFLNLGSGSVNGPCGSCSIGGGLLGNVVSLTGAPIDFPNYSNSGGLGTAAVPLNYGAWPTVDDSMSLEEIMAKTSNNGIGWTFEFGGDVATNPQPYFLFSQCDCSGYVSTSSCQITPNGTFSTVTDCEASSSCGAQPL